MINRDGTKKILQIILGILVLAVVMVYSYLSFKDYINGPKITIAEPINGSTISSSTIIIKGQVLHIQDITLNNRPLFIDKQGNFKETLLLFPGYNVSLLQAHDKFGRTIEYKLELVYKK
ncbi:MAG: hypothetical protein Q7S72_00350 [Candidatus Taylorbacteria bacterium]|nr:hypothetical protein [Candidatus Taylorbacteria bacterium]